MNTKADALHRWRNALHGLSLAMDYLAGTRPTAAPDEIEQAQALVTQAWDELTAAQAAAVTAILHTLGL